MTDLRRFGAIGVSLVVLATSIFTPAPSDALAEPLVDTYVARFDEAAVGQVAAEWSPRWTSSSATIVSVPSPVGSTALEWTTNSRTFSALAWDVVPVAADVPTDPFGA